MKLLTIFKKPVNIQYKHQICSVAFYFVLLTTIFTVIIPFIIVHTTNSVTWNENLILYEQPTVKFPYKFLLVAELNDGSDLMKTVTCSSFSNFNEKVQDLDECSSIKVENILFQI